jgi:hypothetical protein
MHRHRYAHGCLLGRLSRYDRTAAHQKSARNAQANREKFHDARSLRSRRLGANKAKIFIDRVLGRWLKVVSSGAKWTIAPLDKRTLIPNPNVSMPESSGIPSTTRIGSLSHLVGGVIVLKNSFFCPRLRINFSL